MSPRRPHHGISLSLAELDAVNPRVAPLKVRARSIGDVGDFEARLADATAAARPATEHVLARLPL